MKQIIIDKEKALELSQSLEQFCKKNGIWFSVDKQNKPNLKDIIITISIKVLEEKG